METPIIVRKSFALFYGGAKIFGVELDGLGNHRTLVLEKFQTDMATLQKPSMPSQIAIHLKDTEVDQAMAETMLAQMNAPGMHIQKAAIVGLSFSAKRLWQQHLRGMNPPARFVCAYFEDYEKAKEWLIQ